MRFSGKRYALRLCPIRKSRLAAEVARRKAATEARKDGRRIHKQTLEYTDYVMVLCSMVESKLHRDAVLTFYWSRWQIELAFKRFKSLLDAGHVPKESDASARSWMQAKILSSLLIERTLWEGEFFSPWAMALDLEEHLSRWSVFIEVRDCLRGILSPRLTLAHLLEHGPRIAKRARIRRPNRPLQGVIIAKHAAHF